MLSASMIIGLVAALATSAISSPLVTRTPSSTPFSQCWNNPDGTIQIPLDSVCRSLAYNATGYETGTQKVPFGQNFITTATGVTSGPQHCCYRCQTDPNCVGWEIDDNCGCQTWTSNVSCLTVATDVFGAQGSGNANATNVYHPFTHGNCNPPPQS